VFTVKDNGECEAA